MPRIIMIAALWCGCLWADDGATAPRAVLNMNSNWEFMRVDGEPNADDSSPVALHDADWESVHLPHTPRVEPKEFHTHWQGISWYRRKFHAQPEWKDRHVMIQFEAVMQQARVWVNGRELAAHDGGYLPFCVDVSDHLVFDGEFENVVIVRADNRDLPHIPPGRNLAKMDFTYQGGSTAT